jgi:pilus assembly protein CpaE
VSKERIHVVLNRVARSNRLQVDEIERAFGREAIATIPNAAGLVVTSINEGVPFVIRHPDAPISRSIRELAQQVVKTSGNGSRPWAAGTEQSAKLKWMTKKR